MNLKILFFILYLLSGVFLVLGFVFLVKYKRFQSEQVNVSSDVYLFGLVFLLLYVFVMFLDSGRFIIEKLVPSFLADYEVYVGYLILISNLAFILLMSVCYLISVLLMKEIDA